MSLKGRRILVTRERAQATGTLTAIAAMGGVPVLFPTIEIAPPEDPIPLQQALCHLDDYDWIVVTSVNGARVLNGLSGLERHRFAAVGNITASALEAEGAMDVLLPGVQDAEGLARTMVESGAAGSSVLVLRAEKGREVLLDRLSDAGARVELVVAYRTVCSRPGDSRIRELLEGPAVDAALFMSPFSFHCFLDIVGEAASREFLNGPLLAAVGKVTDRAMREKGFESDIVPSEPSVESLLDAVARKLSSG